MGDSDGKNNILGSFGSVLGSGLISGIGSLGASLIGNSLGYNQSKKLMDHQYQLQQQAIDKMNLYNSPVEQMKRLSAAGLSPNLVYGSGVDGNQSSAASPSIANRNVDLANPLHDAAQNMMIERQLQMQEKTTNANVALTAAKTLGQLLDNNLADATMEDNIKMAAQKLANLVSQENLMQSNISLNASRANQIEFQNLLTKENIKLTQLRQATERVKPSEIRARVNLLRQQGKLTAKQVSWFDTLSNQKLAIMMEQVNVLTQQANKYNADFNYQDMYNDFMRLFFQNTGGITPGQFLKMIVQVGLGK